MYLFKNRICEYLSMNFFKNEESEKKSVDSTHTQGASGGESMDPLVESGPHFLTTDTEYVFVFLNITIFNITK